MALARMEHTGNAPPTTLASGIGAGDASLTLGSGTGYPTGAVGKFILVIDPGLAAEEKILCSARSGTAVTISNRGYDNTSAAAHSNGAVIQHSFGAIEADDDNDHLYTTTRDDHTQYSRTDGTRAFTGGVTISAGGLTVTGAITATSTDQATKQVATLTGTNGALAGSSNGAPGSGTFSTGDIVGDPTNGNVLICTTGGSPGTWATVGGPGRILASSAYNPTSQTTYTTGTAVDSTSRLDTTNLSVTFTAPLSGKVIVRWSSYLVIPVAGGVNVLVSCLFSGTSQIGSQIVLAENSNGSGLSKNFVFEQLYTGLTPGTSYTFYPAAASTSGNITILVGGSGTLGAANSHGPSLLTVVSA